MYLKDKRTYISGSIENCKLGYNWREGPIKILSSEFGMDVFDPFSDPKQNWVEVLKKAAEEEDYETVTRIARGFVKKDLTLVDRCDVLVAQIIPETCSVGTTHEIINANNLKKPVYLVCPTGKKKINKWFYGIINHKSFFSSWEELYAHFREIDLGKHRDNPRLQYIYGLI